jgi:hypothetical protein
VHFCPWEIRREKRKSKFYNIFLIFFFTAVQAEKSHQCFSGFVEGSQYTFHAANGKGNTQSAKFHFNSKQAIVVGDNNGTPTLSQQ